MKKEEKIKLVIVIMLFVVSGLIIFGKFVSSANETKDITPNKTDSEKIDEMYIKLDKLIILDFKQDELNKKVDKIIEFNSKPTIQISGTEYNVGDNGTIFLQLLDNNNPLNNSICYITIFSPNKNIFVNKSIMTYLFNSAGLYYYDFLVPNITGVYMLTAECFYYYNLTYITDIQDSYIYSSTPTTNYGNQTGFGVGAIFGTNFLQGYVQFNLSSISNPDDISNVFLYLYSNSIMGNPIINIYRINSTWNESNLTWNNQPSVNNLPYDTKISSLGWNVYNVTSLVKSWVNGTHTNYGFFLNASYYNDGFNFTTFTSKENSIELSPRLLVSYASLEEINDIRGNGEVHVSDLLNTINSSINNLPQNVWNYNGTISNNILSQFAQYVWNVFNSTYNFVNMITENIWNFPARNLTYTPDQNITTQNVTVINQTVNVTTEEVNVDEDAIADAVWTHTPDRNLTYYETSNLTVNGTDIAEQVWNYNGTINDNLLNQIAEKVQCYIEAILNRESGEWRIDITSC